MSPARWSIDRPTAFVLAWAGALTMLLAATWRLWTPWRGTPRISALQPFERMPPTIDFALLALVAYGLLRTVQSVFARVLSENARRESGELHPKDDGNPARSHDLRRGLTVDGFGVVITTVALTGLMLLDQLRWQPWAYHAALAGIILAKSTPSQAIGLLRLVAIAVYAYSAVAKLDAEFAATLGQQMLGAIGGDVGDFSESTRGVLALVLPGTELAIAALLAASLRWRRLRTPTCLGVIAMHAATIALLGPWALGHSLGVLLWNVGFASQTVALFWPTAQDDAAPIAGASPVALAACGLAVFAPALTPLGLWDQWPGWALYAPRGERATLFVHTASVDRLPTSLRPHIDAPGESPWRRVWLDEWTLAETGAPIYPQNRIVAAMSLGLIQRYPLTGRLRVVDESAAWPLSRQRQLAEHTEKDAIAEAADLLGLRPGITWTY